MTDCNTQLRLTGIVAKPVVVEFRGGNLTSDAGVVWLRRVDERIGLTARLAACLVDLRDPERIEHPRLEQLRQRVYQIAAGYEDCDDADTLRGDPAFKLAVGRLPEGQGHLSSQPTLSRFESALTGRELGDHKPLRGHPGLFEARLHFGPGYRLYFAKEPDRILLLLCGGAKSSQRRDVQSAAALFHQYQQEQ